MLVRAGIVTISVSKIIVNCFDSFIYLKILPILNARIKVVDEPKSTPRAIDIALDIIDTTTMNRSNKFPA